MHIVRLLMVAVFLLTFAAGCTSTSQNQRGQVHCPACGTELDALFEKRF